MNFYFKNFGLKCLFAFSLWMIETCIHEKWIFYLVLVFQRLFALFLLFIISQILSQIYRDVNFLSKNVNCLIRMIELLVVCDEDLVEKVLSFGGRNLVWMWSVLLIFCCLTRLIDIISVILVLFVFRLFEIGSRSNILTWLKFCTRKWIG